MRRRSQLMLVVVPLAAYLTVLFLVALFVVKPPALGWLGFAVVGLVGLVIAMIAASVFRGAGVNADPARKVDDGVHRVLVVVDAEPFVEFSSELRAHLRRRKAEVRVVAPVLASPTHFVTEDEERESEDARARLDRTLAALARAGIAADGVVGADDPLQAIGDALASFPAAEIVVVTSGAAHETWLEHGLRAQARQLFRIPVTCIRAETVPVRWNA